MTYKTLKIEIADNIALLTANRPEAMNALNALFFEEFNKVLDDLEKNDALRALIITGSGKAFVAGADISEMSGMNCDQGKAFSETGQQAFARLSTLSIPVIAAVNGFALGGGCELALACDIRIAGSYAKFGQPEVNLGLIPGYCGTQRLPRLIGLSNALYLLLTADMIDAEEAYRLGLVQKVFPADTLIDETKKIAIKIASKGKIAVSKAKEATIKGMQMDLQQASKLEADYFGNLFGNGESGEGMKAFLEKRKPNW